jgi:hypothetical protein
VAGAFASPFPDENAAECLRVFRIPIEGSNNSACREGSRRSGRRDFARSASSTATVGKGSDTRYLHGAAGDIDEEQDVVCHQSADRAHLDGEKICRHQAFPVISKKRPLS